MTTDPAAAAVPDRAAPTEGHAIAPVVYVLDPDPNDYCLCGAMWDRLNNRCTVPAAPTEGAGEGALDALFRYLTQGSQTEAMAQVVNRARAERDALRDTVARIEALHRTTDGKWCEHDGFDWPCPTARAALVPPSPGDGEPGA